jgi:hypothetical protein
MLRKLTKWGFTCALVLLLLGWVLGPRDEVQVARGGSVQVADGVLTLRRWAGERAPDLPPGVWEGHEGIPDTVNIPLWAALLALGAPTALLWWLDRRREDSHEDAA